MITMLQPEIYEPLLWQMARLAGAVDQFAAAYAQVADPQLAETAEARHVMEHLAVVTSDLDHLRGVLDSGGGPA